MYRIVLIIYIGVISACATTEIEKIQSELNPTLYRNMQLSEAIAGLENLGFECMEGTSIEPQKKDIYECARSEGNIWPPFSCIHRVWLKKSNNNSEVSNYEIFEPMCTGV